MNIKKVFRFPLEYDVFNMGCYRIVISALSLCTFLTPCCSGPPTLEDISNKLCSPDKPYKCLPYGICYGVDSYCHSGSGTVISCFPDLDLTEGKKQSWCREHGYNATFMKDNSCSLACTTIVLEDFYSLLRNPCPDTSPHKCLPNGDCYNNSQYCQNGTVKSCFPDSATSDLLNWCRKKGLFDVALMEHKSCHVACQARFTTSELALSAGDTINNILLICLIIAIVVIVVLALFIGKTKIMKIIQNIKNLSRKKNKGFTVKFNESSQEEEKWVRPEGSGGKAIQRQNSKPSEPVNF